MMRRYGREFKLRSIKLVRELVEERGIDFREAAMDMGLSEGLLRRWMREAALDPQHAFPGRGRRRRRSAASFDA